MQPATPPFSAPPARRNGLGDTHERLNFLLRTGRALGRAAFLWCDTEADPEGPKRAPYQNAERIVRPYLKGMFDPGAYVNGFGGVKWRWSKGRREAAERAHPGTPWLFLQYECMRVGEGGCVRAHLRFGENSSMIADVDTKDSAETAQRIFTLLNKDFGPYPLIRLQTSVQGDMTPESRLPEVCPRGLGAEPPMHCDQYCESFFNWRPNRKTWVALRPHLSKMEAWKATVGLTVRTGAADHYGALPEVLERSAAPSLTTTALAAQLEALFAPCDKDSPPYRRDRQVGEQECVNWNSDDPTAPPPSFAIALQCGGTLGSPEAPPMYTESAGPLGSFIECAARASRSLAAQAMGEGAEAGEAWGVMLFSDSPAMKCLMEGAHSLGNHSHVTPTAAGHVQYAPDGDILHAVGRMTIVDWYLIGLMDWQMVVLGSAFGGSTNVRRKVSPQRPEGSDLDRMHRGFERWFESGRENYLGRGVDLGILSTLSTTSDACPITQYSNAKMFQLYKTVALDNNVRYEGRRRYLKN